MEYIPTGPPRGGRLPRHAAPPPPKERASAGRVLVVGIAIGAVVAGPAGCGVGMAMRAEATDRPVMSVMSSPSALVSSKRPTGTPSPSPMREPTLKDFELVVVEKRRQCFTSYGCHVTYDMNVSITNGSVFRRGVTYEITYRVKGADSPMVGTLTMRNKIVYATDDVVRVLDAKGKLRATATRIEALP